MKKFIQKFLYIFAKKILSKYKPEVVGITGSVGKTSTKKATYEVLKNNFNARTNIKNYNTEFGVPLTIIGAKSGGKNILKWLSIFLRALYLIFFKTQNYPEILILEMAADHPGDIEYLTNLAPCKIAVVTAIGPTHLEFFETIENVIKEKQFLVSHLKENSFAVLNVDDNLVLPLKEKTRARIITYGMSNQASLKATSIVFENDGSGVKCDIKYNNESCQAHFKNILAISQISSFLGAIAVGKIYHLSLSEIVNNLQDFEFPKGRLQLLNGIKNTLIIDDTYNSSPKAVKTALEVLSRLKCSGRRFAVLGDMLELGGYSETAHSEAGEWVKEFKVDILVTVGERSKTTARIAEINGFVPERVVSFDNYFDAGKFLQNEIKEGDLILIKGSQGMRMEHIVKEIMVEPERASELLVRQEKEWTD